MLKPDRDQTPSNPGRPKEPGEPQGCFRLCAIGATRVMLRRRTRSLDSTRVFVSSMSHGPVLHLLPTVPSDVLDIGAGTGRDAAALAGMGHRVVAVEPTVALRDRAALLHPSPRIEWIEDYLPRLARLRRGDGSPSSCSRASGYTSTCSNEGRRCRGSPVSFVQAVSYTYASSWPCPARATPPL